MLFLAKLVLHLTVFCILTLLTQTGGVIYLISWLTSITFIHYWKSFAGKFIMAIFLFLFLYPASWFITPWLAAHYDRVPLPVFSTENLTPHSRLGTLLNRHYIDRDLKIRIDSISSKFQETYPGYQVVYLDANFPFGNDFPLLPHLSHDDGEKLDLAFIYKEAATDSQMVRIPHTFLGYGISQKPVKGEVDQTNICLNQGFWQYDILQQITKNQKDSSYVFDAEKTAYLLRLIVKEPGIGKVFIEPHLKNRLHLGGYPKIRFQGCHSVRHDDHIHLQL